MTVPAPYQSVLDQWEQQGIRVMEADWTTPLKRHVGAKVEYAGDLCYAKLAIVNQSDLDEPDFLGGMKREVWWSQVIARLNEHDPKFPFKSPRVLSTNINAESFTDKVAWIILEYIDGQPIVGWEPEWSDRAFTTDHDGMFGQLRTAVAWSLIALEEIHPATLDELGLPPLPASPTRHASVAEKRPARHTDSLFG